MFICTVVGTNKGYLPRLEEIKNFNRIGSTIIRRNFWFYINHKLI